jgi:hypothetical protein
MFERYTNNMAVVIDRYIHRMQIPFVGFFTRLLIGCYIMHKIIILYFQSGPSPPPPSANTPDSIETCYGCKNNITAIEFHMDYGGCKYDGIEI